MKSIFRWLRNRDSATPASERHAIKIRRSLRECITVEYQDRSRHFTFNGELTGPRWKQINICVPEDFETNSQVLDNLAAELHEKGYEFLIYRLGAQQVVPEGERNSALAELRSVGYQTEVSNDKHTLRLSRVPEGPSPSKKIARELAPRMMKLILATRGVRRPMEILRKSSSAVI